MRTRKGWSNILAKIMETGGMTEEMESHVEALRAELDEREGMLKRYGENYDGENEEIEEYDYVGREDTSKEWQEKYNNLAERYRNRMFGGSTRDKEVVEMGAGKLVDDERSERTSIEELIF